MQPGRVQEVGDRLLGVLVQELGERRAIRRRQLARRVDAGRLGQRRLQLDDQDDQPRPLACGVFRFTVKIRLG